MLSSMDSEEDATGYSQRSAYNTCTRELRLKLAEALKAGSKRLLATYLQSLLAYLTAALGGDGLRPQERGRDRAGAAPLRGAALPQGEGPHRHGDGGADGGPQGAGLRHAHRTRDITERMDDMLTRHGFRVAVMKADAVAPERREAWVADRVKQGIDVMICHPRLCRRGWT